MSSSFKDMTVKACLLLCTVFPERILAEATGAANNPHGDRKRCDACHVSVQDQGNQTTYALQGDGNISTVCAACHDGKQALREVHPVDVIPGNTLRARIPAEFPLQDGKLTCLSCHDLRWHCQTDPPGAQPQRYSLRGTAYANRLAFCFLCHGEATYQRYNVHDQHEAGEIKSDTCRWCHSRTPDLRADRSDDVDHVSIGESSAVCRSCHIVARQHPSEGVHVLAKPSDEMIWRISAYEMQDRMRLPMDQLQKYVRAAGRMPQSILLDEQARIQCITCHNPHEQGLLSDRNPRALGAEPIRATNHRLRGQRGRMCLACHEK